MAGAFLGAPPVLTLETSALVAPGVRPEVLEMPAGFLGCLITAAGDEVLLFDPAAPPSPADQKCLYLCLIGLDATPDRQSAIWM